MSIDNTADCCNYIKDNVDNTPCRKKILELTEWIFSLDNTPEWRKRGDGVKFFLRTHDEDHFAVFKLRKHRFTHVDFYVSKKNDVISSYLKRIIKNPGWATMTGKNFCELPTDVLQGHILNSYRLRLNELELSFFKTDRINPLHSALSQKENQYNLNEEKVKKAIETIAGLRDDDNIPVKDIIDFIKSDVDKIGVSLSSNFEDEIRQIIRRIMKK